MLAFLLITGTSQPSKAQDISVSYQTFYDNLAPYGQWIYDPEYGNVWVPNEGGDFRPYGSRGRWVMTEYGNTWVSDDPWGWAVYHYGRWTYNPYYGWIWVPGYEWAPAWVSWRFGGGYAGWAPLSPGISVGVSYFAPDSWWVFVGPQYMYQPNCISYWRGPSYNTTYIRQTTIINNYYVDNGTRVRYNYGPRAEVVQQYTRQPVQVYRVSQLNRPGAPSVGRNTVSLYRPSVNRASVNDARPSRVYQAPRPVGRAQAAGSVDSRQQPAFRQDVQRMQPDERGGRQQNNNASGNRADRFDSRQDTRQQPDRQDTRQQPDRQDTRQQPDPRSQYNRQDTRQQPADRTDPRSAMDRNAPGRRDDGFQPTEKQYDRQSMDRQFNSTRNDQQPDRRTQAQPQYLQNQPSMQNDRSQYSRPESRQQPQYQQPQPQSQQQPARQDSRSQFGRSENRPQTQPDRQQAQPSRPQMQPERQAPQPKPQMQSGSRPQSGAGQQQNDTRQASPGGRR
jgi:hypothetical protein